MQTLLWYQWSIDIRVQLRNKLKIMVIYILVVHVSSSISLRFNRLVLFFVSLFSAIREDVLGEAEDLSFIKEE